MSKKKSKQKQEKIEKIEEHTFEDELEQLLGEEKINDISKILKETVKPLTSEEQLINKKTKQIIKTMFLRERVLTENTDLARELYNQSRYGSLTPEGKVQLSLQEALYLLEKGKIEVYDGKTKKLDFHHFLLKARKIEPNLWIRYCVYKDIRIRGYIIKSALKFGADFRVYDRGIKPGEDHAKWIVYPVHEGETLTWHQFTAKNRVAHSTKKRLLIGIVDEEGEVTYYEIKWVKP